MFREGECAPCRLLEKYLLFILLLWYCLEMSKTLRRERLSGNCGVFFHSSELRKYFHFKMTYLYHTSFIIHRSGGEIARGSRAEIESCRDPEKIIQRSVLPASSPGFHPEAKCGGGARCSGPLWHLFFLQLPLGVPILLPA